MRMSFFPPCHDWLGLAWLLSLLLFGIRPDLIIKSEHGPELYIDFLGWVYLAWVVMGMDNEQGAYSLD